MLRRGRTLGSTTKMNEETRSPAQISGSNLWPATQRNSSSRVGHSPKWPDWNASDVKSKDHSRWPSLQSSRGDRNMQKNGTVDRDVHKNSNSPTFDEPVYQEYSHSPDDYQSQSIRGRSRDRKRSRSRSWDRGRIHSPGRGENRGRGWGRGRDRNWSSGRGHNRSQSGSPLRDLRDQLTEKRIGSRMTSKLCRDFSAGKCRRGDQCAFSHHGISNYRHGGNFEDDLTERQRSRTDQRDSLKYGNYKWDADSPRARISDGYRKYYKENEPLRDGRKDAICCMDFLRGKCREGASCRYPHQNDDDCSYERENAKLYDPDVKFVSHKTGKYPCKYFAMGKCHRTACKFSHDGSVAENVDGRSRDYKRDRNFVEKNKSWNGPNWGNDAGPPDTSKVAAGEEHRESWTGPTWDGVSEFEDAPKATGWGDRKKKTIDSKDPMAADDNQTDDKQGHSLEDKIKVKGSPGWNEKVTDRGEFLSHNPETASTKGWGSWEKDEKIASNDPQCDSSRSPLARPQPSGWVKTSFMGTDSCDATTIEKKSDHLRDHGLENERKERVGSGRKERTGDRGKFHSSNRKNGSDGKSRDDRRGDDLDYKNKSRSGLRVAAAGFPYNAKARGHDEKKEKSWNGPTWADVADSADRSQGTGWGGTYIENMDSHDLTAIEKPSDDKWGRSFKNERNRGAGLGRKSHNEKEDDVLYERWKGGDMISNDERWANTLDEMKTSQTGSVINAADFPDTSKLKGHEEEKINLCSGATWDKANDLLDKPESIAWCTSSIGDMDDHAPVAAEEQTDYSMGTSLTKKRKEISDPGWPERVSGEDKLLSSHQQESSNGTDKGIAELMESNLSSDGNGHQNDAQGSELQMPGGISARVEERKNVHYTSVHQHRIACIKPEIPEMSYIEQHQMKGVDNCVGTAASSNTVNQLKPSVNDTHHMEVLGDSSGSPPPSLCGTDGNCHKGSLNLSNFVDIDLNKSLHDKVSSLDSHNEDQIHGYKVVNKLQMVGFGASRNVSDICPDSVTIDQVAQLYCVPGSLTQLSQITQRNLPTAAELLHPSHSKVSESGGLEVQHQESSMLKKETPVTKSKVDASDEITTKDSKYKDESGRCKHVQENIHLASVGGHCKVEENSGNQDEKAMRLFKIPLVELVKEIISPTWKQGKMNKDVYKLIVKKTVDKVTSTINKDQIPKTQEQIDHYMSSSKLKISKLVEAYVEKFQKK